MKIVLVNQEHSAFGGPGGAERSVQSIAEYFASAGHQVTFITMTRKAYMRDMVGSGIHSVRDINGVRTILLAKTGQIPTHSDILVPVIVDEAPDIVHTNVFHRAPLLWKALAPWGIPVLHSLREYKLMCERNMFNGVVDCGDQCELCEISSRYALEMSQFVDGVVGISEFTLQRHLGRGFFHNAAVKRVIPNSYRLSEPPHPRAPRSPKSPIRIGFLGRMHASKGINLVIDAFSRLDPAVASLVMAGDMQDEAIGARIDELARTHDAKYLGFVDPLNFFPQIDVLLAPSIWHEPFGRITIEAFANGVPVIATNRGGLPDIVQDGVTGWIFDPDRPEQLVDILKALAVLPAEQLDQFRERALVRANDYLPEKIGEMYLDTYNQVIEAKRKAQAPTVSRVRAVYEREAKALNLPRVFKTNVAPFERKPLKVLIVSGEFPKLSETFVLSHVTGLIDLGVDVRILHTRTGAPSEIPPDYVKYRLHDRAVSLLPMDHEEKVIQQLARPSQHMANRMNQARSKAGLQDPQLSAALDEGQGTLLATQAQMLDLHAAQKIAAHVKDVDIVHCHFGHRPKIIFKYMDLNVFQAPVVCSFHGIDVSAHINSFGPTVYDDVKTRLHKALPVSDFFRRRLISLGFNPKDVQVHRVGIDCSKFAYADRRRGDGEVLKLLSVGRLVHKKGIEFGIRAVAHALAQRPDLRVEYLIAGDGTEMPALRTLVRELGMGNNIQLLGSQPHSKVTSLMASSHAMLTPSVTGPDGDMEGIPTVTMEAMASGLPVVSTYHSGIPEAVIHGYTGLLAPERDYAAMAEQILTLYDHPELTSRFGRQGRAHVLLEFNIARQNEKVLELYRRIVTGQED